MKPMHTALMTDLEFLDFISNKPVSGACGTHGAEKAAAAQQTSFTNSMLSQATSVFGADSSVFNAMSSAYSNLLAAGPQQQGFSAAELSSMNSQAITNGANQARFIEAGAKSGEAGFGGGNAVNASGVNANENAGIAEKVAAQTDNTLANINQANWAQGNANWKTAGEGLEKSTGAFNNLGEVDSAAQKGLSANMSNAQAADAASNWWVKPVESIAGAGLNVASGGLMSAVTGGMGGGNTNFGNSSVSYPQYMSGGNGASGPQAPTNAEAGITMGSMPQLPSGP
jgi:hypothetical protein